MPFPVLGRTESLRHVEGSAIRRRVGAGGQLHLWIAPVAITAPAVDFLEVIISGRRIGQRKVPSRKLRQHFFESFKRQVQPTRRLLRRYVTRVDAIAHDEPSERASAASGARCVPSEKDVRMGVAGGQDKARRPFGPGRNFFRYLTSTMLTVRVQLFFAARVPSQAKAEIISSS
jgi:hypothetical protein